MQRSLPFAFGGEAKPVDYARAMADGALLLLIATLGLLQLGHQTTPELAQLAAVAGLQWALAAAPHRGRPAQLGVLAMLPTLAACGAPAMAVALGMGGLLLCWRTDDPALRALRPWLALATALAALVAWPSGAWVWRVAASVDPVSLGRLLLWFLWPAWPLALWTLWRWRGHLAQRHLAIPLLGVGVAAVTCVAMDGSDRALMLGLPGIAVLAAFALPTLSAAARPPSIGCRCSSSRSAPASYGCSTRPCRPARRPRRWPRCCGWRRASVRRCRGWRWHGPAWPHSAWLGLVRWRTGRHQAVIWKSVVLPAGGVALCWLLLMTLWLPLLDYGRSNRPLAERLVRHVPAGRCIAVPQACRWWRRSKCMAGGGWTQHMARPVACVRC